MKRNIFLIIILMVFASVSFAQKPSVSSISKKLSLGFGVYTDIWMKVPDSINPRGFHQGADVFIHYTFQMDKKGRLNFFLGAGIGSHNFYNQALLGVGKYNVYEKPLIKDPSAQNVSYFYNAPPKVDGNTIEVKKSKLSLTYIDVPFGMKYKAKNGVHGSLGFTIGWKINAHTKYKGSDLQGSGYEVKNKECELRNIQTIHYGPTGEIGYKWFAAKVFYQISTVFEKDLGPEIYPISVGLVFSPF